MLTISRKKGQSVLIGDDIEVFVGNIEGGSVRISIKAPADVQILRNELVDKEKTE